MRLCRARDALLRPAFRSLSLTDGHIAARHAYSSLEHHKNVEARVGTVNLGIALEQQNPARLEHHSGVVGEWNPANQISASAISSQCWTQNNVHPTARAEPKEEEGKHNQQKWQQDSIKPRDKCLSLASAVGIEIVQQGSSELLSSKCDYVKALYGFGPGSSSNAVVGDYRRSQAARVALQNYLHFRRGLPLDDAVLVSGAAPRYTAWLLQRLAEDSEEGEAVLATGSYEQVRSSLEAFMQREGVDEMEPFLESLGVAPSEVGEVLLAGRSPSAPLLSLTGEQGLLNIAKALEEVGIARKTYWKLLGHNKQLLHYSLRDCMDAVSILELLGVPRQELGRAVEQCPGAFRVELEEEMKPVVAQLARLGMSKQSVGCIILGAPTKLEALMQVNAEALVAGMSQELRLSREQTLQLVHDNPLLLVGTSISKVAALVTYLKGKLLLEEEDVGELVQRYPRLLLLSLERSLVAKVDYLKQLGVKRLAIKRIVMEKPEVLSYSLDDNLKPKVCFLESLGLDRFNLGALLGRSPAVLADLLASDLRRKANFLVNNGLKERELADIFYVYPEVIAAAIPEVKRRLHFLRTLGADGRAVGAMLAKHPQLLGYDVLAMQAVVDYLRGLNGGRGFALSLLMSRPSLLGAPTTEVAARVAYLDALGFERESPAFSTALAHCAALPLSFMDARIQALSSLGLPRDQLLQLVRSQPRLLYRDEDISVRRLGYYLHDMELPLEYLLRFPYYLKYHLEDTIKPRHRLISWLKDVHVVRRDYPPTYLHMSRREFEETFLDCHPAARDVYRGGAHPIVTCNKNVMIH